MPKIKLVIVEDSKLTQQMLEKIFSTDDEISVVGVASDPYIAREIIKKTNPDIITLDIMMPHMDGITFLKNLMRLHPMPVVMVSALTEKNSAIGIEALSLGAVDYISKPSQNEFKDLDVYSDYLINAVKNAAKARVKGGFVSVSREKMIIDISDSLLQQSELLNKGLIVIGASMGGIEAIEHILTKMPKVMPPIIIVQHIRKEFSGAFAKRIDKICSLNISEAKDNEKIVPSHVYIAPGGVDIVVKQRNGDYVCLLQGESAAGVHMPSIDVLFKSAAKCAGDSVIGVILTGMGKDGVVGLQDIKGAGGVTIAQDESSSVIWGMPGAAVKANAIDYIVPLQKIPQKILSILEEKIKR